MDSKKTKKYCYKKNDSFYVIEKDLVGWYLIIYDKNNPGSSSADYLFDTLEDAFVEAEDRFGIPKNSWKEIFVEDKEPS